MAFSRLPNEIKDMIFEYLIAESEKYEEDIPLSPYVTVNRSWQTAFEKHIFSHIRLSTGERLAQFNRISWSRTRSLIKSIALCVELESYSHDGDARYRFERVGEQHRNNIIFTVSIQSLLNTLANWPTRRGHPFILRIGAYSPDDECEMHPEATLDRLSFTEPDDIFDKRFERSWLQFDEKLVGVQCKSVPSINVLWVGPDLRRNYNMRKIEPVSCSHIMAKLPGLQYSELNLDDASTPWDPEIRYRHRKDFADSIPSWPSRLADVTIRFPFSEPFDETYPLPILAPAGTPDPLSLQLHKLSQRLRQLRIVGCVIGSEILGSLAAYDNVESPSWPTLKKLWLNFVSITPCGIRLFEKDAPEELTICPCFPGFELLDYEDMDSTDVSWVAPEQRAHQWFVRTPNHEMFNKYFLLAGKAALQMPKLVSMRIQVHGRVNRLNFAYEIKDARATVSWVLVWDHRGFEPSDEVKQIWKEVAIKHTGQEPEDHRYFFVEGAREWAHEL